MVETSSCPPTSPSHHVTLENCNEIVGNLYLGGIAAALHTQTLVDQGIRAVVCCVRESEFPSCDFHKDLAYYRVDVEDVSREPIELFWPEALEFIHGWISKGAPVFVHCRAGVSRSASTVIAYLVARQSYSLIDAFHMARNRRPVVTPNLGFMEKLCEFEMSTRATSPTIDVDKYESWYTGSQLLGCPDVASAVTTANTTPTGHLSPTMSPAPSLERVASTSSARMRAAVRKLKAVNALCQHDHKTEVDLDCPLESSDSPTVRCRIARIRTMLLRQAAIDPSLGYCQGMHLVAAMFAATSGNLGEAYWRFHAFVGGVRGLWLPGLPLVAQGTALFEALVAGTRWRQHLRAHGVEPAGFLPQAWVTLFTTWLPRADLAENVECLEGRGFAGVLAMTVAIFEHVGDSLCDMNCQEDILRVMKDIHKHAPRACALGKAMRQWLPRVRGILEEPPSPECHATSCQRQGSRIEGELFPGTSMVWPSLSVWVADGSDARAGEPKPPPESLTTNRSTTSCWAWCLPRRHIPRPASDLPRADLVVLTSLKQRRASVNVVEQQEALASLRQLDDGNNCPMEVAREQARRRRSTLTWAEIEH